MSIVLSSRQMKDLDMRCISDFGLPALILMENAGKASADFIMNHLPPDVRRHIIILHGNGNNSGDGFVIARWLHEYGCRVMLIQLQEGTFSAESEANYTLCHKLAIPMMKYQDNPKLAGHILESASLIVDAVFGIGFRGELPGTVADAFAVANGSSALRIAIDIPSGISADTGSAAENAFCADHTLAIHACKQGHLLHEGKRNSGKLQLIPIGIPQAYHKDFPVQELLDNTNCRYPARDPQAHKGSYGKVFIIGGSRGFSGSVALASRAALRSGAGYVYLVSRKEMEMHYISLSPEIMFRALPHITNIPEFDLETYPEFLQPASSILIGPGLGTDEYARSVLELVLEIAKAPVIVDADAITLISQNPGFMEYLKRDNVLITPHPGEFARISGISAEDIKADIVATLRDFCSKTSSKVLLKGDTTIYCDADRMLFNIRGNDGLATGGSGDVLGGIIASFIAQGMEPGYAAINASHLMGKTAEELALLRGTASIIPSDIIDNIFRHNS